MLGVFRRETKHLLAVHDSLAEAVGDLDYAVFGLLMPDGIEIDGPGHARHGREEITSILAAAYLLYDDSHLLFRDDIAGREDVTLGRREEYARIHALDSLGKQAELLCAVLGPRDHIRRVHARKRLMVGVFKARGRTHRQGTADDLDECLERIHQLLRKVGRDKLRQQVAVAHVGIDDVLKAVLGDEAVEPVGRDDESTGYHHMHVLPLVVEIVFLEDVVQESQAARLATDGSGTQTREPDGIVESLGIESRHHSQRLRDAVVVDDLEIVSAMRFDVFVILGADGVQRPSELEYTPGIEPLGEIVLVCQGFEDSGRDTAQKPLEFIEVPRTADLDASRRIDGHEITEAELALDVLLELLQEHLGALAYESYPQPRCHGPHAFL